MADRTLRAALYLRVSTADQTVQNQRLDLERVAAQRGWRIEEVFVDHGVSGAKGREQRREFDRLCKDAAQGKLDLVAAWSLDRIGRSTQHLLRFLNELRAWHVGLYIHQSNIDTTTPTGELLYTLLGAFAQFEREIIRERIHAGLARARAQGKTLGRKPVSSRTEERIRELRGKGLGKLKIATQLRCGVSTVQRVLSEFPAS